MGSIRFRPGRRYPLGATPLDGGVNFSIFSRHARSAELLLFDAPDALRPFAVVELNPHQHRFFYFWSVFVEGVGPGTVYAWRLDGPSDPRSGCRFDPRIELLDPWARQVSHALWDRDRAKRDPFAPRIRAMVPAQGEFDWEGDTLLDMAPERAIIYELHVGGFTKHLSSGVTHPGTFLGLMEKIPYLRSLGITHVELLPIMAFDEQDVPDPVRRLGLKNFWGYSPHSFYALHPGYLVDPHSPVARDEFKALVKALHRAGIGVIMDVVFNHTAEGGEDGVVINFKGMNNRSFYHLDPNDPSRYLDFTGCGNTVKCNHPLVSFFIVECLEYWVREFHVDGFRFDLASVLVRGEDTKPMHHAPVVWSLEFSRELEKVGLIAEAWDASGFYQVGAFPGYRWQEWNGRYRDVIRRFVRGDSGLLGEVATRLAGSSDLYEKSHRLPFNGINYVTCHDGFTLMDLVSYRRKHNEANGEENRDGLDENYSCNYGVEGETNDQELRRLRLRQMKNFMALLMVSQGVPMLLAGDELLRTQRGNNNAWCQDNELGWLNWESTPERQEMVRFVQGVIALRRRHPSLMRRSFLTGRPYPRLHHSLPDIQWFGPKGGAPSWGDPAALALAFLLAAVEEGEPHLFCAINMRPDGEEPFLLPEVGEGGRWRWAVDTTSSEIPPDRPPEDAGSILSIPSRSIAVMEWVEE